MNTKTKYILRFTIVPHLAKYWHLYVTFIAFLFYSAYITWLYRDYINPDGISYLQAARHYAAFDLKTAINGYWSPLLSWLIVPFIWLQIEPLVGFRIISIVLPLLVLLSVAYYMNHHNPTISHKQKYLQSGFMTTFGITLVYWSNHVVTPDALSGIVLLGVIISIYRYFKLQTAQTAALLGASLALLYFAKSVGFYIGLGLIAILFIYEFIIHKKVSAKFILIIGAFLILSGSWITLISLKYNELTISTASSYNFALYGPDHPRHPQTIENQYLAAKHTNDIWAWDDPSYLSVPKWSILENWRYYQNYVIKTANSVFTLFLSSSPLLFIGILAIFIKKRDPNLNLAGYALAAGSCILLAIYCLIYIEMRYVWIIAIPIIAFGATIIRQPKNYTTPILAIVTIQLVGSLFWLGYIYQSMYENQITQNDLKLISQQADKIIPDYSKVAGHMVFELCYFSNTQCSGNYILTGDKSRDLPIITDMRSHGIKYYFNNDANIRIDYLPVIFNQKAPARSCFDYFEGKTRSCYQLPLVIYKL